MPKQKYNYANIKSEFLASEFDEVKSFITHKWLKYSAERWRRTKGRAKEKQEIGEKALKLAVEKKIKEEANSLEMPINQLKQAKKTTLWLVMKRLQQIIDDEKEKKEKKEKPAKINVKELEGVLKMIKTELWEPTNISKTDATIKWEPIPEDLLIKN